MCFCFLSVVRKGLWKPLHWPTAHVILEVWLGLWFPCNKKYVHFFEDAPLSSRALGMCAVWFQPLFSSLPFVCSALMIALPSQHHPINCLPLYPRGVYRSLTRNQKPRQTHRQIHTKAKTNRAHTRCTCKNTMGRELPTSTREDTCS